MATRKSGRKAKPTAKYEMLMASIGEKIKKRAEGKSEVEEEWEDVESISSKDDNGIQDSPDMKISDTGLEWLLSRLQMDRPTAKSTKQNTVQSIGSQLAQSYQNTCVDPIVYLTGSASTKDALDICDFVNLAPVTMKIDMAECKGANDVLDEYYKAKCGAKKPRLHEVTVAQWSLANARIMDRLFFQAAGDIQSSRRYLAYTAKISELFSLYERVSVLEYDRKYRIYQVAHNLQWGVDIPHLAATSLVPLAKQEKPKNNNQM